MLGGKQFFDLCCQVCSRRGKQWAKVTGNADFFFLRPRNKGHWPQWCNLDPSMCSTLLLLAVPKASQRRMKTVKAPATIRWAFRADLLPVWAALRECLCINSDKKTGQLLMLLVLDNKCLNWSSVSWSYHSQSQSTEWLKACAAVWWTGQTPAHECHERWVCAARPGCWRGCWDSLQQSAKPPTVWTLLLNLHH